MREAVRVHLLMQALACFAVGLPDARHALRVRRRRQVLTQVSAPSMSVIRKAAAGAEKTSCPGTSRQTGEVCASTLKCQSVVGPRVDKQRAAIHAGPGTWSCS